MAARDLTRILLDSCREFDFVQQEAICLAIVGQLEDPYVENQANAVSSLQQICPLLSEHVICKCLYSVRCIYAYRFDFVKNWKTLEWGEFGRYFWIMH